MTLEGSGDFRGVVRYMEGWGDFRGVRMHAYIPPTLTLGLGTCQGW